MLSTTCSSTSLSASRCNVHRLRPSGAWLQAVAISFASPAPSSLRYCRWGEGARCNAASSPPSTNCCRTRWTVERLTSANSATRSSLQPGAPSPWSALSSTRARCRTDLEPRPSSTKPCNRSCSSASNRTRYLASLPIVRSPCETTPRRTFTRNPKTCQDKFEEALGVHPRTADSTPSSPVGACSTNPESS